MSPTGYPVEGKVNVAGPPEDALSALGLTGGLERSIWFFEDLTPGIEPDLPLLSGGVVLRARSGKSGDFTLKLRPCRRTQLTPEWAAGFTDGNGFEYRVEQDWTGQRRTLAASSVIELDPDLIASVVSEGADADTLLAGKQREFLHDCGTLRIAFAGLTPLGPIRATKWKNVPVGKFDTNIERWEVADLDFLEVSIRSETDAERRQQGLETAVRALGLSIDDDQESKTRRVLAKLARLASEDAAPGSS
ncbi:hypothetical protein AHIS1636_23150 [Arthrobacter mangrovi]|uniref:CYTH domain-containing protein n=2 Tax=Arthrobacter mangrovi TaxID=2966350 RepID=A0ABQ5MVA2_9MICC|nr:hypothetical protein AHIS1636_23150 [Arthrobacter mangrovi]